MRIGMILDASFPPDPRVENEALSLIKAGHEVFLFSLDFENRSGEEVYKNIHVIRYPASKLTYKLSALAYTFPFYRWRVSPLLNHFIHTYKPDAIHVHDMVIAECALKVCKPFKLPVILDLHENRPEIMKEYKHVKAFPGRYLINLTHWRKKYYQLSREATYIVVVTETAKEDIVKNTKRNTDRVQVVPNSVRLNEFLSCSIDNTIIMKMQSSYNLLYIGDTSLRRGTDTAIQAVASLMGRIPEIKLWLVGKSSADNELKRLTKQLGAERNVMFEGWRSPETFLSYLQASHIGLSPLKRNIHHDTTYANKVFQYMAGQKPLIVSDCIAQAEIVEREQCGLVYKADDYKSLVEKIIFLYQNRHLASEMGRKGRVAVSDRWNWDVTVNSLLGIYNKLEHDVIKK